MTRVKTCFDQNIEIGYGDLHIATQYSVLEWSYFKIFMSFASLTMIKTVKVEVKGTDLIFWLEIYQKHLVS